MRFSLKTDGLSEDGKEEYLKRVINLLHSLMYEIEPYIKKEEIKGKIQGV
jgi:hypothetical protein